MAENHWLDLAHKMFLSDAMVKQIVSEFDELYARQSTQRQEALRGYLKIIDDNIPNMGEIGCKLLLMQVLKYQVLSPLDRCDAVDRGETIRNYRERGEFELRAKAERAKL
jgi:hypothetical protein